VPARGPAIVTPNPLGVAENQDRSDGWMPDAVRITSQPGRVRFIGEVPSVMPAERGPIVDQDRQCEVRCGSTTIEVRISSVTGQALLSSTRSTDHPAASVPCNVSRPIPPEYVNAQTGTPGSGPPQLWNAHAAGCPERANSVATASGVAHCPALARSPAVHASTTARAAIVGVEQLPVGGMVAPVDATLAVVEVVWFRTS
jgi:hypothetical protein